MQLYVNASWADGCNKSVFNSISTESSPVICKQALSVMSNHTLTLMTELLKALECIVLRHNIQITNITICVSHVKFPDQLSVSPKLEKSIILCLTFSVCHFCSSELQTKILSTEKTEMKSLNISNYTTVSQKKSKNKQPSPTLTLITHTSHDWTQFTPLLKAPFISV